MKQSDVVRFWKKYVVRSKPPRPPYVHPQDSQTLEDCKVRHNRYHSYEEYISHYAASKVTDGELHMGLLPVPYVGDIQSATLYILMLNPGFSHEDYVCESNRFPSYRDALLKNLSQQHMTYPFFKLRPEFLWTGAGRY